ncbi:MAG TPA: PilN domain-containing protein [Syntrophomonadaceae bacterium]|nr:PilN domain-containing protein [Syntrophomonadaceae bacterium]
MKDYGSVNINLLERDTKRERAVAFFAVGLLVIAVVLGTMAGLYFYETQQYAAEQKRNTDIQASLKTIHKESPLPDGQKSLKGELSKKESTVKQAEAKRVSYADVLGEIENAMPAPMAVNVIEFSEKKITLQGFAREYANEAELLSGLRRSPVFKDVILASSKLDTKSQEIEFRIEMNWEAGRK